MLRQVIVNADDYGYTPGISQGILDAHRNGIVTSTSVMVNMPAAEAWVKTALEEAPDLGLGLHLNLTTGRPVSKLEDVEGLARADGFFHGKRDLINLLPTIDPAHVERELLAQVARFEAIAGRLPDHLDSHHHITYMSPPTMKLMVKLARELEVPIRRPLPGGDNAAAADFLEALGGFTNRAYVEELADVIQGYSAQINTPMPDHLNVEFHDEQTALGDLLLILLHLPEGVTELMCHPGRVDDELRQTTNYVEPREAELAALTHPSAREVLNSEFIQLLNFGDLKLFAR